MAHEEAKAAAKARGSSVTWGGSQAESEQGQQRFHLKKAIQAEEERIKQETMAQELDALKGQSGGGKGTGGFAMAPGKGTAIGGSVALDQLYGKSEPGGIHRILGTSAPIGGTDTNLFTVLTNHTCRMSVLWVTNRRLIPAKIRVGFDIAGGGTDIVPDAAWLYYQAKVPAESTLVLDAATGFWLGAADDVVVRTDLSGVSFGASGVFYATV